MQEQLLHRLSDGQKQGNLLLPYFFSIFHPYELTKNLSISAKKIEINGNRMTDSTNRFSKESTVMSNREKYEAKKSIVILIGIFVLSLMGLFYVYLMFPELEE